MLARRASVGGALLVTMDHRGGVRHPVHWAVTFLVDGHRHKGTMRDVSLSGAFVASRARVSAPGLMRLNFRTGGSASERRQEDALVVRVTPQGFGVEWEAELPPQWLRERLEDEARRPPVVKARAPQRPAVARRAPAREPRSPLPAEMSEPRAADEGSPGAA